MVIQVFALTLRAFVSKFMLFLGFRNDRIGGWGRGCWLAMIRWVPEGDRVGKWCFSYNVRSSKCLCNVYCESFCFEVRDKQFDTVLLGQVLLGANRLKDDPQDR